MNVLIFLAVVSFGLALLYCSMFLRNLSLYVPPPAYAESQVPKAVSVLIPARNEENAIQAAVESALNSKGVGVEVIVLDDGSEDRTAAIVRAMQAEDSRVRLETAPALPAGWCGKQFACSVLSKLASHQILCFIDSDVRLRPEGLARMVSFLRSSNASLVSGFPHQELGSFYEKLLLPFMHFLLLGFLPMDLMRQSPAPSLGAGCGQIFVADLAEYTQAGGHAAIRSSRHDGIKLPRAFRLAGLQTDLCDASEVADCRMYRNGGEVISGLLKNANEGIAAPIRILVFTVLLVGGHVMPEALLFYTVWKLQFGLMFFLSLSATALSILPRILAARRFSQPLLEALLHPFAVLVFLGVQWRARFRDIAGTPAVWKGRKYQPT